jgi:4-hydroxyphenylacetate 3-monooxygenase
MNPASNQTKPADEVAPPCTQPPPVERYLQGLRDGRQVYVAGKKTADVTKAAVFQPILKTICALIEHMGSHSMRAVDPKFALSLPRTKSQLADRALASEQLAERSYGLLGRLNDYTMSYLADMDSLRGVIAEADPAAADRLRTYVAYCLDNSPLLSHAVSHPQIDRSKGPIENGAVRVERVESDSVILSGTRMVATLAPLANELLILPFGPYSPHQADLAVFCAIPLNLPGVSIHVRPVETQPDDPLAPFDEPDAMVILDQVRVPIQRLFLCRDTQVANKLTSYHAPLAYLSALSRSLVRLEFMAGIARALLHAIGAADFPHNRQALGEAVIYLLSVRGLLSRAIDEARHDSTRQCFVPRMEYVYAGLLETASTAKHLARILCEHVGCGVLMRIDPRAVTDQSERSKLEMVCAGTDLSGQAKAALFRLAWSIALGPVGTRQLLFDNYAFGDPFSRRSNLALQYDWRPGFRQVQKAVTAEALAALQ